mgnify:CR=1 FL=1
MSLQQASANAVSGILGALSDEDAAALIAGSCKQRPGLRDVLLKQLSSQQLPVAANSRDVPVEPRKRVKHSAEFQGSPLPRPGANGGEYTELDVCLLSGRTVAAVVAYGNDRVGVLKAEIARQEGTPVWQQQLLIDECELEDQEPLKSYCFLQNNKTGYVVVSGRKQGWSLGFHMLFIYTCINIIYSCFCSRIVRH